MNTAFDKRSKLREIQDVVHADTIDLIALKKLALSKYGLINAEMRRVAWPLLFGISIVETEENYKGRFETIDKRLKDLMLVHRACATT